MLNPESRFLREIPQELIEWRRTAPAPSFSAPVSGAGRFGTPRPRPPARGAGKRPLLVLAGRRSGDPRQVRAGPGRGSLGRRRIGDVADRLRERGPGQADAQPRPGQQALRLAGLALQPALGLRVHRQHHAGDREQRKGVHDPSDACAGDEDAAVGQHRDHRARDNEVAARRRRCNSRITPETVAGAKTRARNATAMQNRRSVRHQPAIRSVATTDVAHPLTMLTARRRPPSGHSVHRPSGPEAAPRGRASGALIGYHLARHMGGRVVPGSRVSVRSGHAG